MALPIRDLAVISLANGDGFVLSIKPEKLVFKIKVFLREIASLTLLLEMFENLMKVEE